MTLSTERDYEATASTGQGDGDAVLSVWAILGYELVPEEGWVDEAEVLSRPDVQGALNEGLHELRKLRERSE